MRQALLLELVALLVAPVAAVACGIKGGFEGAGEDLFDPEVTFIGRPQRLAEGPFTRARAEVDLDGNRFLIAIDADQQLTLIPLDAGETVIAGRATDYLRVRPDAAEASKRLVAFVARDDEVPELRFTDLQGELSAIRVETDRLPRRLVEAGPDDSPGVEVVTNDGRILFINPWEDRVSEVLCSSATEALVSADCGARFGTYVEFSVARFSFTIQPAGEDFAARELVVRNARLQEAAGARFGEGVVDFQVPPAASRSREAALQTEALVEECTSEAAVACRSRFATLGAPPAELSIMTTAPAFSAIAGCAATEASCRLRTLELQLPADEAGDVTLAEAALDEPIEDACFARYHEMAGNLYASYFSPCASGRLWVVARAGRDAAEQGVPCWVDEDVTSAPLLAEGRVIYMKESSGAAELWTQPLPVESEATEAAAEGPLRCPATAQRLAALPNPSSLTARGGAFLGVVDFDSASGLGELRAWREPADDAAETAAPDRQLALLDWSVDGDDTPVAGLTGVAERGASHALARFAGEVGELFRIDIETDGIRASRLGRGVPRGSVLSGEAGDAFLADYDGNSATLRFFHHQEGEAVDVASDVAPFAYQFGVQFDGLLLSAENVNGSSTLQIWLEPTRDSFSVSRGVVDAREVSVPSPGILYSVGTPASQQGIWFAPAR